MTANSVIDFLMVSWIAASVVLLVVFARYGLRSLREHGARQTLANLSYFNGLIIHHTGNLVLLTWFWLKVHRGEVSIPTRSIDSWILITGTTVACCGVLYKLKIFSDSLTEIGIAVIVTLILSTLSILSLHLF
jgi:hypothetical protein